MRNVTFLVSPGCKRDFLESPQILHTARHTGHRLAEIQLHRFLADALARVGHVN